MKIRKCPDCAQLIHFEPQAPLQRCWNCGKVSDFSALYSPLQRLALWLRTRFDRGLPDPSRLVRAGTVALVVAVPLAIVMLLICNSLNIFIVHDASAPFLTPGF